MSIARAGIPWGVLSSNEPSCVQPKETEKKLINIKLVKVREYVEHNIIIPFIDISKTSSRSRLSGGYRACHWAQG
jgi:hypothetical protein